MKISRSNKLLLLVAIALALLAFRPGVALLALRLVHKDARPSWARDADLPWRWTFVGDEQRAILFKSPLTIFDREPRSIIRVEPEIQVGATLGKDKWRALASDVLQKNGFSVRELREFQLPETNIGCIEASRKAREVNARRFVCTRSPASFSPLKGRLKTLMSFTPSCRRQPQRSLVHHIPNAARKCRRSERANRNNSKAVSIANNRDTNR